MPLFTKKPVTIEARQWDGTAFGASPLVDWILNNDATATYACDAGCDERGNRGHYIAIHTLEGTMRADDGDWIIKGVQGEFYPCKPDIFEATYEAAE
jgi:hypothetical protein